MTPPDAEAYWRGYSAGMQDEASQQKGRATLDAVVSSRLTDVETQLRACLGSVERETLENAFRLQRELASERDAARTALAAAAAETALREAEKLAERIVADNDVPEMYGAGQRRAAERILSVLKHGRTTSTDGDNNDPA